MSNPNFESSFLRFELLPTNEQPGILGMAATELRYLAGLRKFRGDHSLHIENDENLAKKLEELKNEKPSIHELERLRDNNKTLRDRIEYLESVLIKHQIDPYKDE